MVSPISTPMNILLRKPTSYVGNCRYIPGRSHAELCNSLGDHFGARGVQTFILQKTVKALQISSQSYLDELSDETLRIQLELDTGDRILRTAAVLTPDGSWVERPLSSFSG
jgi:hypothetical protein